MAGVVFATTLVGASWAGGQTAPPPPTEIVDSRQFVIHFDSNRRQPTAQDSGIIAKIIDYIAACKEWGHPVVRIVIVGYTDSDGPADYNVALSKARAIGIADALVAEGVPSEYIAVDWKGESSLLVPAGDDVMEPLNRRVTIDPALGDSDDSGPFRTDKSGA